MESAPEAAPKTKNARRPALPPAERVYRKIRKRLHLVFFLVFVALPFSNLMRFDLPRQRFYFAGFELWISEFAILFFLLMFLMFVVAASAIIYGRIYCSYACPQMIFSEASVALEAWARKRVQAWAPKWPAARRQAASKLLFLVLLVPPSIFLAFVFTSYFVPPRDLLGRLEHLDLVTVGGLTGATVTLITYLDFALVRQRFCTTVCPYGYLQGMLQDRQTLLVAYQDPEHACIECNKCVRVCEMGIDIRESPYQIECVHCGDCVDACEDVLRRVGHEGLIHYAWGEADPGKTTKKESRLRAWGFRDAKRGVILLVLLFYFSGLAVALSVRRPVLVRVAPDRTTLYRILDDGRVANGLRVKLANRSAKAVTVALSVEGLAGAELALDRNPIPLAPGETFERTCEIRAPRWSSLQEVNPVRILAQSSGERTPDITELNFILPAKGNGHG